MKAKKKKNKHNMTWHKSITVNEKWTAPDSKYLYEIGTL